MTQKSRKYDYIAVNRLSALIELKKHEIGYSERRKVNKSEVYETLAKYCGVSDNAIKQIIKPLDKGGVYPSLPLALKIAEFFDLPVDQVFTLQETL